jgi:hypothetical protein
MIAALLLLATATAAPDIDAVAATVQGLPAAARDEAAASLRTLSVSDPYTRAALQLPFALNVALADLPATAFDPVARQEWLSLQAGVATHVAVLEALGVDLPAPGPGEPLFGSGLPLPDLDTLRATDDPVATTAELVDGIVTVARRSDGPTRARIEAASDRVERATGIARPCPRGPHAAVPGHPWTLGMNLGGWHDALRRVEPFAKDPATRERVSAMIDALDHFGDASFVSVYQVGELASPTGGRTPPAR